MQLTFYDARVTGGQDVNVADLVAKLVEVENGVAEDGLSLKRCGELQHYPSPIASIVLGFLEENVPSTFELNIT